MKNILNDLRMRIQSRSYIDAMHSILTHKQWTSSPKHVLAGMTVNAFRFSVHRRLTAESLTAYNWQAEHFLAADFIGIASSQQAGFRFSPTFPLYQKQAVLAIKQSIDSGTGAVMWKEAFVVAVGYDESREVIYYSDGSEGALKELAYGQFGCNESPYWYYQVFEHKLDLDEMEIYQESLIQAVYKWEVHDPLLPEGDYACGRQAYDAMIEALRTGAYDKSGAWEVIMGYAAAKRDIGRYTRALAQLWPACANTAQGYAELVLVFERMIDPRNRPCGRRTVEAEQAYELIPLLIEARSLEEKAVQSIRNLLRERIGNRFHDIGLR